MQFLQQLQFKDWFGDMFLQKDRFSPHILVRKKLTGS